METEQEIQDAARTIISFTDSQANKKERRQNEQPESESADSLIEITAYLEDLRDKIRNNNAIKQMIKNQNLLRPLASLTIFKLGNHSNQEVDRLRFNVRSNSRWCLRWIQEYGDAQEFADLVNVEYGKVICISLSTAGGIGEEDDEEIFNVLYRISYFLRELHKDRNHYQPSFQPLPLHVRKTEEQIEEEGAIEEVEAQLNNYGPQYQEVKFLANKARAEILNHFINRRRI
ncbi:MAG: hypothetical protein EZS28_038697 [Streblomastix strix]|uniref:Uncharacterized protein n=1 Tax=Streblomastix strix TaxID=222440 RepID=A0A5J4U4S4_9EUKA|nr:MAG: hypothetical protein EZS28_038697 [Streblomastix strix]